MAEPLDPKEVVDIEELVLYNIYEIEALIEVLVREGNIDQDHYFE